jgi:mono/diheme cytochrome c family protein
MKKFTAVIIAVAAVFAFSNLRAADAKKDGKEIFTASKCTMCHTVDAAGIKKAPKKTDLTGVAMPADKIATYLMKETELNGKKHAVKFSGSKEDLAVMAKWLTSFKAEKK